MKNLDPKTANRFYKALVERCGNTKLGQGAAKRRWFPTQEAVQGGPAKK
ncbi:MAG: hypothetical protein HY718_00960 [Planctomycetes bacterium]|nr:hypothetical protein [Planctomycetota bacterium]